MSNIANAANGSEERKLRSIVYRALREELAVEEEEVSQMAISAISFVKHLGIMVTALVRVDLEGENENTVSEETTQAEDEKHTVNTLDEGMFIERILRLSESSYEHSNFKWIPIVLPEMKKYIEENSGFYTETIQEQDGKDSKWISYAKLQMYEIWRNYNSINIQL